MASKARHVRDPRAKRSLIGGSLRRRASEDLEGWVRAPGLDPRMPLRRRRDRLSGPWIVGEETAHGLYERVGEAGRECAAAYDGWMLWRWRAPRVEWAHPLLSPWNAILADDLVTSRRWEGSLQWPKTLEDWTADAVVAGWLPAASVELGATDRVRSARRFGKWVQRAKARGLAVDGESDWAVAAQPHVLGGCFALDELATAYSEVLPGELSTRVAIDLVEHGAESLLDLAMRADKLPLVVRALVDGYSPDMVAGMLHAGHHHDDHHGGPPEQGLYCPGCWWWPLKGERNWE